MGQFLALNLGQRKAAGTEIWAQHRSSGPGIKARVTDWLLSNADSLVQGSSHGLDHDIAKGP